MSFTWRTPGDQEYEGLNTAVMKPMRPIWRNCCDWGYFRRATFIHAKHEERATCAASDATGAVSHRAGSLD